MEGHRKGRTKPSNLREQVDPQTMAMYPTPSVACEEGGEQSERVERTKSGGFVLRKKNNPNMTYGAKLSDAMLYLEKGKEDVSISNGILQSNNKQEERSAIKLPHQVLANNKPGGRLNPLFVEFLMGFPMNWTKIEQAESKPSETQSSHKLQDK